MLKKGLNDCGCRFLLRLRHQHSLCDQEAQHARYLPLNSHLPDGVAAAKLYFLSLSQPELPNHDEPIDTQNSESQSALGREGCFLPGTARGLQEKQERKGSVADKGNDWGSLKQLLHLEEMN